MGSIRHLPQHLINKLKAGEIVERPASVVKELLENALDAGATELKVWIEDGGKTLIKIQDNGSGITPEDLPLSVARYATSKIYEENDLEQISSYGFRGEALAAIAEVSKCRLQSKIAGASTGYELIRAGEERLTKPLAFDADHGTIIIIQDLFYNTPVRKKFLKSTTTERHHTRSLLFQYVLLHRDKTRTVRHQGKIIRQLAASPSLLERVAALTHRDRQPHLQTFQGVVAGGELMGILGDASLHFPSAEQLRFFVNRRPVEDKIMKKALMQAMHRQMPAGLYPFAYLFLEISPDLLDVNVHPRKLEVKFIDPGSIFTSVLHTLEQYTGEQKVSYASFTKHAVQPSYGSRFTKSGSSFPVDQVKTQQQFSYHAGATSMFDATDLSDDLFLRVGDEQVTVIGQLWQTYILAESATGLYLVDQHALAERIAFERMKEQVTAEGFAPEVLLQPLIISLPGGDDDIVRRTELLSKIGIDAALFGPGKLVIYSVPTVFQTYQLDMQQIIQQLRGQQAKFFDEFSSVADDPTKLFSVVLEEILGMKACKASIKAGQPLSLLEMRQLLRDGQSAIPQMFVCQHGRPSIVKVDKGQIEKMVMR